MNIVRWRWQVYAFVFLAIANGLGWYVLSYEDRGDILTVTMLNIGQGDAIFIQTPSGNQILVDGGPANTVLGELSHVMPFYDRSIDMLMVTNPDADHMSGFVDVLQRYSIHDMVEPGTVSGSATYAELERQVKSHHVLRTIARRDMRILLDQTHNIYIDIYFPDRDVSTFSTNDGSIIARLVYGDTAYMLMGDAPQKMEKYVMWLGSDVHANVLKVGHHGSRTSTAPEFVRAVHPELAIISAGFHNKYGHPHQETLDTLKSLHIPYVVTFEHGRIVTESDGKRVDIR